jgi:outer membrane immunogenic protein
MKRSISLGLLLLSSAGVACADEPGPVYVGAALGTTDYSLYCNSTPCNQRKHQVSGKIYLGYTPTDFQLSNPNIINSFELMAYAAGANEGANWNIYTSAGNKIRFRGVGIVDSLRYRIDAFSITGRLGIGSTRTSVDFGQGGYDTKDKVGAIVGVGAAYALNQRWTLKADVDQVPGAKSSSKKTLNLFTAGVEYRF